MNITFFIHAFLYVFTAFVWWRMGYNARKEKEEKKADELYRTISDLAASNIDLIFTVTDLKYKLKLAERKVEDEKT